MKLMPHQDAGLKNAQELAHSMSGINLDDLCGCQKCSTPIAT